MRLIDADWIKDRNSFVPKNELHTVEEFLQILDEAPTIDAVPVVRCKECYLGRPIKFVDGSDMIACEFDGGISRFPGFYCKAGDRKDGADNG